MYPYSNPTTIGKTLSLLKNIKWGELLDNTGKTLGVINQAIPIVYQAKPIFSNAKTLMKIVGSMNQNTPAKEKEPIKNQSSPIFYL